MSTLGILACVWLGVCGLVLLVMHIKSHRILCSVLLNALLGVLAMAVLGLTKKYTGVSVPFNWYTVLGSGTFGIPAVCGFLALNMLL